MNTNELNNISEFVDEKFNEEEMMEVKGGAREYLQDTINNGTGCGCSTTEMER